MIASHFTSFWKVLELVSVPSIDAERMEGQTPS